jgi:fructose-specific phosphotransferase system IIC component
VTPEQHNKYLALAHLAYGTFSALFTLGFLLMFGAMFVFVANAPAENNSSPPPAAFLLIIWLFFGVMYATFTIPSFIAGYALLKRKRWAKIASIIGGVMSAMFFPIGTAVCVYTFWFLFSEPGKVLYDTPTHALPPPPLFGVNQESVNQREFQHDSPATPPDWR